MYVMKKIKDILLENNDIPEIVNDKAEEAFSMIREMRELDGEELGAMRNKMKKQDETRRYSSHFWRAKVAAAVVCATLLLGTGAYAAEHYWNLSSYLKQGHIDVPQEAAEKLMDTGVSQQLSEKEGQLVDFAVQEALTDGDMVYLTVEAKTKEAGKYLMVPEGSEADLDKLSWMGFDSELTAEEYAKEQGLELLCVGSSFSNEKNSLDMDTQSIDCKYDGENKLVFFIYGQRGDNGKHQKATVINTVRPLSMSYEEFEKKRDTFTSFIDFTLKNKSKTDGKNYVMEKDTKIDGTTIEVTDLAVEETDLGTYVTIQITQDEQEIMEKGTAIRLKDSQGQIIEESRDGEGGFVQMSKGHYQAKLKYAKGVLPDQFMIEIFDCELDGKPVYDQIRVEKK